MGREDVSTAEARKNLADLLNKVAYRGDRVVVTRRGREVAAIVPVEEAGLAERLRDFLSRSDVAEALDELDHDEATPWRELKRELGL